MSTPPALPLPMFPLGTVLFPHMTLPLHVFEARYQALVQDCLRSGREFGVVLIERGSEVGGGDIRFAAGTVARIVAESELGDGRWALVTRGTRRIRVLTWLPDDPYPVALVEDVEEPGVTPEALELLGRSERRVRRALALASELGLAGPGPDAFDPDPAVAIYQLCAVAPVGPVDRQALLEASDHVRRLEMLAELADGAAELFAYRLSGR